MARNSSAHTADKVCHINPSLPDGFRLCKGGSVSTLPTGWVLRKPLFPIPVSSRGMNEPPTLSRHFCGNPFLGHPCCRSHKVHCPALFFFVKGWVFGAVCMVSLICIFAPLWREWTWSRACLTGFSSRGGNSVWWSRGGCWNS